MCDTFYANYCAFSKTVNSDDCSYLNNCHRSAQCLQDGASNSYVCRCNPGFIGDGYRCREEPSVARVPGKSYFFATTIDH